ncbi:sensor histidine kinase [Plantactinospora endophytica]|uniref:histidine kinase n=1 Tax=Plantactinospora endophytica TaxID=673535 RepID=A0ABQ4EDU8_9ACTN|nr:sensor histidine kinase [Plantactinospora endophytica]GIG92891.1 two-component sensor histidine kinase [Plantactinospora endophytica]
MESGTAGVLRIGRDDLRRLLVGADFPPSPPPGPPGRWRRRWQYARPFLAPLLIFALVGITIAGIQYLSDTRGLPEWVAIPLAVGGTLPAVLAPFRPLFAWRFGYPLLYLGTIDALPTESWPWNPVQIIAFLFVLLVLAARTSVGIATWAGLLSVLPAYVFVPTKANSHGVAILFLAILIVGDQVRRRRQSQRALAEQAERSELEQARRAVLEERTRIAREMHDVVAHHMSMIAVQAETAPYRLTGLPEPARDEFTAIAGSAREALADMRRLLGVLRSESAAPETAPQPGLADVPELVEAARRAGMAVTVATGPEPAESQPVPEAVGLAAYRIIQEALANAARHAPGTAVRVSLDADERALIIGVWNDPAAAGSGAGRPDATAGPAGHGLTGMRERARLLGGRLRAGPTDNQGYAVTAHLPYEPEPTPPVPPDGEPNGGTSR